jgi:hypothetical protein
MATFLALVKLVEYDPEHSAINANAHAPAAHPDALTVNTADSSQGYVPALVFVHHGISLNKPAKTIGPLLS